MVDNINIMNVGTREGVASEATLSALLTAFKASTKLSDKQLKSLDKLGKGYTPGSGKDPSLAARKSLGGVSDAANVLESSLRGVPRQFEIFGDMLERGAQKPIEVLGNSLKNVGNAAENIAGKLPLWLGGPIFAATIGVVTTSFGMLAGYLQNSLDAFQDLSTVGGNFGNDLIALRKSALMGNLSLEEFSGLVRENSVLFSVIGGNVSTGADTFSKLSLKVREFESKRLRGLGYTVTDVNDMLLDYLDVVSKTSDVQSDLAYNQDKVVAGAVKFGEELNQMSAITGLSRKQISKEIKEVIERGEVLGALSRAEKQGAQKAGDKFRTLITAITPFGKTAQAVAGDLVAFGGAFRTKESRALLVAAPEFAKTMRAYAMAVSDNSPPAEVGEAFTDMALGVMESENQLERMAQAGNTMAAKILSDTAPMRNKYKQAIEKERRGEEGALKRAIEADRKKIEADTKISQALASLDEVFRRVRSSIMTTIIDSPVFKMMMDSVEQFASWLEGPEFKGITDELTKTLGNFLAHLGDGIKWMSNIFTETGRTKMWNDITKIFSDFFSVENRDAMWKSITDTLKPIFETLTGVISTGIFEGWKLIKESILGRPTTNTGGPAYTPGAGTAPAQTVPMAPTTTTDPLDVAPKGVGQQGLRNQRNNGTKISFDKPSLSTDRSSLYSMNNAETIAAERIKTMADYPKAEQDQIKASLDSKNALQEIKNNNDELINLFKQQLGYQEQQTRDIKDLLDIIEKNA